MLQDVKVYSAAFFGLSFPGLDLVINSLGPLLDALLVLAQVGVAAVTILYILAKRKKLLEENQKDDE